MKELNHFVLVKELVAPVKGYLYFTKWHSDNLEGLVEVEPNLIGSYF